MGSAQSISVCAKILSKEKKNENQVVVTVSAVGGITDFLIELIELSIKKKTRLLKKKFKIVEKKHWDILRQLCTTEKEAEDYWCQRFAPLLKSLEVILYGSSLVGDVSQKTKAVICSFGEKLSIPLLSFALQKEGWNSCSVEGERIIRANGSYLDAEVDLPATKKACQKQLLFLLEAGVVPIVTGFVGKNVQGETVLLGRGGSDYTASIVAVSLKADCIEIWTDVNGIISADPRLVDDAISWEYLDMNIVSEMAYSGAKVIHPKSIVIAIVCHIPVYIFNTFDLSFQGTKIIEENTEGVKGIVASVDNVLFHLDNPNMLENVGFIAAVTGKVSDFNIPIDVCTTSETSFTFSCKMNGNLVRLEKDLSAFAKVHVKKNLLKISVIGNLLSHDAYILEKIGFFFAKEKKVIHSMSMGMSYRNITFLMDEDHWKETLQELHRLLIQRV